jgi:hypothetical protein
MRCPGKRPNGKTNSRFLDYRFAPTALQWKKQRCAASLEMTLCVAVLFWFDAGLINQHDRDVVANGVDAMAR